MDNSLNIPIDWLDDSDSISTFDPSEFISSAQNQAYSKFWDAVSDIKAIRRHYITVCATSWGKDSTVVVLAALQAHIELMQEGVLDNNSPFVLTHIDTKIENHLMQMASRNECDRLTAFCEQEGINLDIRIGQPPLAKQWAALFLSGLKIISSARTNNDCSVIMKRDNAARIERDLEKKYGSDMVTLLGTRLDESASRKQKMQKHGTDKRSVANILDVTDKGEMVFAPIKSMNDDDVWTIIRCAGTQPITIPYNADNIPSYAPEHRLLHIIYSDSKDGTCPTTAKRVKGQKDGGCGGSARTGCYLCAKTIVDKSGEAQATQTRHAKISSNIIKVRNYIMYVAQDIDYRTYHSRAVHQPTGAIALQPNVLNAQTIDKLMFLLSQATWDDAIRAQTFRDLVEQGKEMDDEGYADIMNDENLAEKDRLALAEVYKKYAQENLIQPMSFELATYLSAIHARDGVRLPPYRALYIWDKTSRGERIPYPVVDPRDAKVDDIPDAIMVIPNAGISIPPVPTLSTLDHESAGGCNAGEKEASTRMPASHVAHFIEDYESSSSDALIRGLFTDSAGYKLKANPASKKEIRHKVSKRAIKKVSRKGGVYKVIERGRTSLDTPSFGERSITSDFTSRHLESVPLYLYDNSTSFDLMVDPDDSQITGYDINMEHLYDWNQFGGSESALNAHDRFVELHLKHDGHIYYYGGIEAFMSLERYGVLRFNTRAKQHTLRILQRTAYFNAIGLLALDEKALVKLAHSEQTQPDMSLSAFRRNIRSSMSLGIDKVLSMTQFRAYFAEQLVNLRQKRNADRMKAKALVELAKHDPVSALETTLISLWERFSPVYRESAVKQAYAKTLLKQGCKAFDGDDYGLWLKLTEGNMRYMEHYFNSEAGFLSLLNNDAKKELTGDAARLATVKALGKTVIDEMTAIRASAHTMRLGIKEDVLVQQETLESANSIKDFKVSIKLNQKVINSQIEW